MSPITAKQPFILTIFGASGDLAKLKIFPSLYRLAEFKRLPKDYYIVGFARTEKTREAFQNEFSQSIKKAFGSEVKNEVLGELISHVYYFSGQYGEVDRFRGYRNYLTGLLPRKKITHLAYFSVPSVIYKDIIANLAAMRGADEDMRLILEKPFGENTASAEELFHFASRYFKEEEFYLLDHYLGKTAVRSMLRLRENNRIFSHMMRGYEIANIQITALEDFGVKERASYFDQVGTLKDYVQSHVLQMLALLTMSLPISESAQSLQREKHAMLSAISCPCDGKSVVFGQYQSYTSEKDIPKNSRTETYVAARLFFDRLDWHQVPIYIRTGKMLAKKHTYAVIELKKFPFQSPAAAPNRLIYELYPEERLTISITNKLGEGETYQELRASQSIGCSVEEGCLPEYAALILDVLKGEKKYFLSFAEILAQWQITDQILVNSVEQKVKLQMYADKSFGPEAANLLPKQDGFAWFNF